MLAGYIYILINPSYKQLLKIGKTSRLPEERAAELSSSTGIPTRFYVAYQERVDDCDTAESFIHKRLEPYRVNSGREFFELPLQDAIRIVSSIASEVNRSSQLKTTSYVRGDSTFKNLPQEKVIKHESGNHHRVGSGTVQRVAIICGSCGRQYSVTMLLNENHSVCPTCFHTDIVNIQWDWWLTLENFLWRSYQYFLAYVLFCPKQRAKRTEGWYWLFACFKKEKILVFQSADKPRLAKNFWQLEPHLTHRVIQRPAILKSWFN